MNKNKICNIGVQNAGLFPTITGIFDQCSFRFTNVFANNSISLDGGAAINPVLYGGDLNSVSVNPSFLSASDLHTAEPALDNSGIFIHGIDYDLDGNPITDPPDIGCYQFNAGPSLVTTADTDVAITTATLNGTGDPSGDEVNIFFDYGLTSAYGITVAGEPPTISGDSITRVSLQVTGLTGNTTCHFRTWGVSIISDTIYGDDMIFTTVAGVPVILNVSGEISNDTCFNATDSIIVAGIPNTFIVTSAGDVTMIAGLSIRYLPTTTVESGGHLLGQITLNNEFCTNPPSPVAGNQLNLSAATVTMPAITANQIVHISPNPTEGMFMVELTGNNDKGMTLVEIVSMGGLKMLTKQLNGERKSSFTASFLIPGLYFIYVNTEKKSCFCNLSGCRIRAYSA